MPYQYNLINRFVLIIIYIYDAAKPDHDRPWRTLHLKQKQEKTPMGLGFSMFVPNTFASLHYTHWPYGGDSFCFVSESLER